MDKRQKKRRESEEAIGKLAPLLLLFVFLSHGWIGGYGNKEGKGKKRVFFLPSCVRC